MRADRRSFLAAVGALSGCSLPGRGPPETTASETPAETTGAPPPTTAAATPTAAEPPEDTPTTAEPAPTTAEPAPEETPTPQPGPETVVVGYGEEAEVEHGGKAVVVEVPAVRDYDSLASVGGCEDPPDPPEGWVWVSCDVYVRTKFDGGVRFGYPQWTATGLTGVTRSPHDGAMEACVGVEPRGPFDGGIYPLKARLNAHTEVRWTLFFSMEYGDDVSLEAVPYGDQSGPTIEVVPG